ncbi:rootletin-like isoform X3 [Dermacentor albipictus]|uniref:rootletin-like isoform X3 n=1 Tax=Dermacentor albipictus TaxID=60249 RepID=UPI0031FD5FD2
MGESGNSSGSEEHYSSAEDDKEWSENHGSASDVDHAQRVSSIVEGHHHHFSLRPPAASRPLSVPVAQPASNMGGMEESRCVRHRIRQWEARAEPLPPVPSRRCSLLESALGQCPCRQQVLEDEPEEQHPADLPSALAALEAERQRCRELVRLNVVLREHLEITTRTNEELTSEVHELTEEWRQADRSQSGDRPQGLESRLFVVSQWQQDLARLRQDLAQLRQAVCTDLSDLGGALATAWQHWATQAELTGTTADRQNLSQQIAGDLNRQVEALNAENDRLQRALDQASHLAHEQRQALDLSSCEVDRLRGEVSELQTKLTRSNDTQLQCRNEESSLRVQLDQQRTSAQRELEALRAALRRTQELNDRLEAERDAQQAARKALNVSSEQLERQARESTVRLESLLRESESHQAELRQELNGKHHELLDARAAHLEAMSRADALSKDMDELQEQLSVLRRDREAQAVQQAEALARQIASQEKLQQQARSERETLEEAVQRAQAKAEAQAEACLRARKDIDALQGRLSEERAAHQEALAKHDQELARVQSEHRTELQRLRAEHEALSSRILEEQGKLRHQLSEQLRQQRDTCTELQKRLNAEADAFRQRTEQLESLGRQAKAAHEEERKLLVRGLALCRNQLPTLRHQLASLRAQASQDSLQPHLSRLREAFVRLVEQERSLQEQRRQAGNHAAQLQEQLEQARLRIEKLEAEIVTATRQISDVRRSHDEEREQLSHLVAELRETVDKTTSAKDAAQRDAAERFRELESLRAELAAECSRLWEAHEEEQRVQRAEADAKLQREGAFWKAKVSLHESEVRAARAQASQLQEQLQEVRERLAREQASHRAQAGQAALQRTQDQADWQRRLLHEGQDLHQTRLALSAAQGKASALEAHLEAVAESRQRTETVLSSLLSALRCALGVPAPREVEAGGTEEEQLVVGAVQGLVSKVSSLASDKEKLAAEAERCRREQRELRDQLVTTASDLSRLKADRERLNADNVQLQKQTSQQEEEASRLRLELKTVQLELSSLHTQLEESTRRLELQSQQLERLKASSRDQLLEAQLSEKQAELELAQARLGHLQRCLTVSHSQQQKAAEKSEELARTAGDATVHKVEHLQKQLASEQLRSERLAERERALEAQLHSAETIADSLRDESKRICAELESMRREKNSLEAKFSAVAVQLAESEAAKQRLHRQKTLTSSEEGRRLREENRCLEQELGRLRHQLSRTVDAMFVPQPRTSTPKKREAPDGQSLHRGPEAPTFRTHQLEAHLRTTLQLDVSRSNRVDADQSSQAFRAVLGLCTMETVLVLVLLVVALVRALKGDAPVVQPGYDGIPGCCC